MAVLVNFHLLECICNVWQENTWSHSTSPARTLDFHRNRQCKMRSRWEFHSGWDGNGIPWVYHPFLCHGLQAIISKWWESTVGFGLATDVAFIWRHAGVNRQSKPPSRRKELPDKATAHERWNRILWNPLTFLRQRFSCLSRGRQIKCNTYICSLNPYSILVDICISQFNS